MTPTNNSQRGSYPKPMNKNTVKKSFWKKYRFPFIYTILILLLLCENQTIGFFVIFFKIALSVLVWIQVISSIRHIQILQITTFIGSSFVRRLIIIASSIFMVLSLSVFAFLIFLFIFWKGDMAEEFEFIFEVFSLSLVWAIFCVYLLFKWKLGIMLFKGGFMAKLVALTITGLILFTPVVITNIAVDVFLLDGKSSGSSGG